MAERQTKYMVVDKTIVTTVDLGSTIKQRIIKMVIRLFLLCSNHKRLEICDKGKLCESIKVKHYCAAGTHRVKIFYIRCCYAHLFGTNMNM